MKKKNSMNLLTDKMINSKDENNKEKKLSLSNSINRIEYLDDVFKESTNINSINNINMQICSRKKIIWKKHFLILQG